MKINNVLVLNWEPKGDPPGIEYWNFVRSHPDEPLIEARIDFVLSSNEYQELLDKSKKE